MALHAKPFIRALLPTSVRRRARSALNRLIWARSGLSVKSGSELAFWQGWFTTHGIEPETDYYRAFMLAMGGLADAEFFREKSCIDIGCGPKGSLTWLDGIAKHAIGIDPLASRYELFNISSHNMLYIAARAEELPLRSSSADVVFSMNSLDHVDDLEQACGEIRRVLKPGGHFIGSLNLDEPATPTEPWTLTEDYLERHLFRGWTPEFRRVCPRLDSEEHWGPYRYMFERPPLTMNNDGPRALWCRYRSDGSEGVERGGTKMGKKSK
ncbi:MAG: class I SAM-dependent methyltransferase [Mesorhizobium sp.]|nr:MAG: class I SAM-dependent methyltransferase [Mesorhizobium sp.]RWP34122.1 MAG: class I SAM-dependent methyltransferase [Mesorhizobium sp.]